MVLTESGLAVQARGHPEVAAVTGLFFGVTPMITLIAVKVLELSAQEGSALRLAGTFALFGIAVVASFGAASRRGSWTAPVKWCWAFLALAGCSFAWGQAASPLVSAAYWLGTACEFGVVVLVMRGAAVEQTAAAMMKGYVWGALIVACAAWAMPAQYDLRLGDEEYFNSNNIAYVCAFAAFFAHYLMRTRKAQWGWALLLLTVTILRSLSKATIGAFLVSQAWLLFSDNSIPPKTKRWMAMAGVVLLGVFSGLFIAYFGVYTSYGNQAETLTGRTAIWAWAFSEGLERPLLGHGFDSMWKVAPVFGTFEARHAENELLQQFYAFGVAGLVVAAGCYVSMWQAVSRAFHEPHRKVWAALLIFVMVRGLAEAEPFDLLLPLWMIALLASLASTRTAVPRKQHRPVLSHNAGAAANVIGL